MTYQATLSNIIILFISIGVNIKGIYKPVKHRRDNNTIGRKMYLLTSGISLNMVHFHPVESKYDDPRTFRHHHRSQPGTEKVRRGFQGPNG